jgi:hypothetical protein
MKRSSLPAALAWAVAACAGPAPVPGSVSAIRHRLARGADLVDEIVTLETRPGVRQSFLLATEGGAPPRVVALVFPGGPGVIGLPADVNRISPSSLLFLRALDRFRDRAVGVAVLDAPSDHRDGMEDDFRSGPQHARDVASVVHYLHRRYPSSRIFLVGTSRGTVSAAHLGRALGHRIGGVVLISTVFSGTRRYVALRHFDFRGIAAPLLFVHHAEDRCFLCPYTVARELGETYPLITVRGGRAAASEECGPLSAHGYFGKEAETVGAIKSWMLGRPYPSVIE